MHHNSLISSELKQNESAECSKKCSKYGCSAIASSASLSAELLKNRDEVVATYGDRWKRIRSPQVTVLRTFMRAEGRGILETAHRLARQYCDDDMPNTARFILAVAVEEIEAEGRAL